MASSIQQAINQAGLHPTRCLKKRCFSTVAQAIGARGSSYNGFMPRAYYCQEHHAWHLTKRIFYHGEATRKAA